MKKEKLQEPAPIKGDPDFAGVARERLRGPADYDESAGNELQQESNARRDDAEESSGEGDADA
jgi:hypothetical protein